MAVALKYEGRAPSRAEERIVIEARHEPALFFEFFTDDYHVYGPRRATPDDVVSEVFLIHDAFNRSSDEARVAYRIITSAQTLASEKQLVPLSELKSLLADTSEIQYMDVTSRLGHVWADIKAGIHPHFGFATPFRLYNQPLGFLRNLTTVELTNPDLDDIAAMLRERTSERYRVP